MFDLFSEKELIGNPRIICIDDSQSRVMIYRNCFAQTDFLFTSVGNACDAVEKMQNYKPELVLLDAELPDTDCAESLAVIRQFNPDIPVILISSAMDQAMVTRAFQLGIADIIRKPFYPEELLLRCRLQVENLVLRRLHRGKVDELQGHMNERVTEMRSIKNSVIFSLARLAESRDPDTGQHLERIKEYVKVLAESLALEPEFRKLINEEFLYNLYNTSVVHDIGKVGIPDHILLKPGPLDRMEFEVIKTHTIIGADALLQNEKTVNSLSGFLQVAREIALYHHERWNGKGYPFGLSGIDIPLTARITAIADVYDALSFKRVYRPVALSDNEIERIMMQEAGQLFDPAIFTVYLRVRDKFQAIKKVFGS